MVMYTAQEVIVLRFRQKVMKEQLIKFALVLGVELTFPCLLSIISLVRGDDDIVGMLVFWVLFSSILIAITLIGLYYLEHFEIYDDKIVVKTIYGIKSQVMLANVLSVEEKKINLIGRGELLRDFYVLNDGRNDRASNGCYNGKKYNVRIYKTPELTAFLSDHQLL